MRRIWGGASLFVLAGCGGSPGRPAEAAKTIASASAPVPPPSAQTEPVAVSASLKAACDGVAEKNRAGKVPLPTSDDPDVKLAPLALEDFHWESVGKCHVAGDGAWAIDVTSGGKRLDVSDPEMLVLSVDLVYVDSLGREARLELPAFNPYFAGFATGSTRVDVEAVADLSDDAKPEIALCVTAIGEEVRGPGFYVPHPISQCALFGVAGSDPSGPGQILRVETAPVALFTDADKDGRIDIVSATPFGYPGRPGYCSLKSFACMDGLDQAAPQFLYHSVPGGFNPSDAAAYDYAKEQCASAPTKRDFDVDPALGAGNMINIVRQVGCSVLYRVPTHQVGGWLQGAANKLCQDPGDCEEFQVLASWLSFDVPIDLSAPRP